MNRNYQNKTKESKKQVAIELFIIIVNLDEVWENSGLIDFNAIQDGVGQKVPSPYQFFPCNFYKRRISPQNLLTFSFDLLTDWCEISGLYLVPVPNYWTWAKTTAQKRTVFLVKS